MRIDTIKLENDTESPLYLKLADALRRAILSGEAAKGERLPSIRRLSDSVNVNPATAVSAYRILEREGWVLARAGSGVYVAGEPGGREAPRGAHSGHGPHSDRNTDVAIDGSLLDLSQGRVVLSPSVLDMAAGTPSPALFPVPAFKALMDEVLDRDGGWAFGYQESAGWLPFREALADYAHSALGITASADDIRVVSGAQQGIDLAAKALLKTGDSALVEAPTYRGALAVFWSRGADTITIPMCPSGMDTCGLDTVALENQLQAREPRLAYVIPRYQNPTTACWKEADMRTLLDLAERHDFYVLEDDLLSDLHYGIKVEPSCLKAMDRSDRVIYVRSFSKVLMPGLRLGMLVVPRALRERFEAAKRATDISTDGFIQRAVELYMRRGLHIERLEFLKTHYAGVYAAAVEEIRERLEPLGVSWVPPGGGLHVWLRLPAPITGTALHGLSLAKGAAVVPSSVYGEDTGRQDSHIRVSFASLSAQEVRRGIRILEEVLKELLAMSPYAENRGPSARPFL
jgi:DNA-binding transcriptional MocR family regulator